MLGLIDYPISLACQRPKLELLNAFGIDSDLGYLHSLSLERQPLSGYSSSYARNEGLPYLDSDHVPMLSLINLLVEGLEIGVPSKGA